MNLPAHITIAVETLKNTVLAVVPRKSDPLFAAGDFNNMEKDMKEKQKSVEREAFTPT